MAVAFPTEEARLQLDGRLPLTAEVVGGQRAFPSWPLTVLRALTPRERDTHLERLPFPSMTSGSLTHLGCMNCNDSGAVQYNNFLGLFHGMTVGWAATPVE